MIFKTPEASWGLWLSGREPLPRMHKARVQSPAPHKKQTSEEKGNTLHNTCIVERFRSFSQQVPVVNKNEVGAKMRNQK